MRKLILLIQAVFLMQLSMNTAMAKSTNKPTNKILKIGVAQEFENLNPLIMTMLTTTYLYKMANRTLVSMDHKGNWVPQIVKELPSLKNKKAVLKKGGKHGKYIVAHWEILENAKWGDGTPVTGHDVKFAWETAMLDTVTIGEKEVYTQITKIDIDEKNPKKFSFTYEKAKWDFSQLGTFYILPKHLEASVVKKHGKEPSGYEKNSKYTTDATNPGLYNGPYRIKEIKLGSHVELVPNKYFYGEKPKIQKIILRLISDTGTMEANLRSGEIDMISKIGLTFDQALVFEKKAKKNNWPYLAKFKPGLVYEHIDFNLRNEFLKDINVRKALALSVDRDKLTQALFSGRQQKAIHNVAPIDPWYTDNPKEIVLYKHSKRKARKLLKAAGWKINKEDGFRYKNGKRLSFQLMTTSGNRTREQVQSYLQNQWKKIGVEITIKNEPARVYFGETVHKAKYPAMAMYAWISSPENTPRATFHSKSIPSKKNNYSGQNSGGWKNKTVDDLIDKMDLEFNAKRRAEIASKILYHYTNEVPVYPLYYRSDISIIPKNLKGHKMTGTQFSATNTVEDWDLQ
ncbi:MAG: peptide ABC transporter substrate-binding protein [Bdellovibrionaceae bacterium]|jgi:peptide/nickel transport system substrate-binding protein|nr:peptide ABC transporter substrate-binding protein [Pseudobdellovibrionaceae bacterium]